MKHLIHGLILVFSFLGALACSGSGTNSGFGGGGGLGGQGGGGAFGGGSGSGGSCSIPKSQGLSQPCCESWGVDACGAGLFCAAFDGRTQATCYAERSRVDLSECGADSHCVSGDCNGTVSLCRSLPGTSCQAAVGCAEGPDGSVFICDPTSKLCMPAGRGVDDLCEADSGCDSGHCYLQRCQSGLRGSPCADEGDCQTRICVNGACRDGLDGSPCAGDTQCAGGLSCVNGNCSSGGLGSKCASDSDCSSGARYCVYGKCGDGWWDSPCADNGDCDPQYPHCTQGRCDDGTDLGQPCTSSSQCAQGETSLGKPINAICDASKRTCVVASSQKCDLAWDSQHCQSGTSCQPDTGNPGSCSSDGGSCSGSYCCGPGSCSYACYDGWACLP